jgi:hypothetical protein
MDFSDYIDLERTLSEVLPYSQPSNKIEINTCYEPIHNDYDQEEYPNFDEAEDDEYWETISVRFDWEERPPKVEKTTKNVDSDSSSDTETESENE